MGIIKAIVFSLQKYPLPSSCSQPSSIHPFEFGFLITLSVIQHKQFCALTLMPTQIEAFQAEQCILPKYLLRLILIKVLIAMWLGSLQLPKRS